MHHRGDRPFPSISSSFLLLCPSHFILIRQTHRRRSPSNTRRCRHSPDHRLLFSKCASCATRAARPPRTNNLFPSPLLDRSPPSPFYRVDSRPSSVRLASADLVCTAIYRLFLLRPLSIADLGFPSSFTRVPFVDATCATRAARTPTSAVFGFSLRVPPRVSSLRLCHSGNSTLSSHRAFYILAPIHTPLLTLLALTNRSPPSSSYLLGFVASLVSFDDYKSTRSTTAPCPYFFSSSRLRSPWLPSSPRPLEEVTTDTKYLRGPYPIRAHTLVALTHTYPLEKKKRETEKAHPLPSAVLIPAYTGRMRGRPSAI